MVQPCMLMILDGFGVREEKEDNAIKLAQMPNYNRFLESYPHTTLQASGYDVGLPKGLMGNSEVGHLNMSAGEIVWQTLSKIDRSIEEGTFAQNPCLNQMIDHALSHQRAIHLMGLTSDGGVHASDAHHRELLKLFQKKGVPRVYFHAFMDGRDTPPKSGIDHINRLDTYMKEIGCGEIVTVSGRYYPMDRDKRWERVEKGYRA
ncbi:MAG: 2,3-bisphosphoglycerate-independent phosphoglycerate mutase, partial [Planctomycetota bacterium]